MMLRNDHKKMTLLWPDIEQWSQADDVDEGDREEGSRLSAEGGREEGSRRDLMRVIEGLLREW